LRQVITELEHSLQVKYGKLILGASKLCHRPPQSRLEVPKMSKYAMTSLAVWLSDNAFASINVVALRQTQLVLGWVTVCGRVNHLGM